MDLTTIFQTVYTVCFILAGVLFATAVFVFFRFNIREVIESLFGIKMPGKRTSTTKKDFNKTGKRTGKTEQVFSTATLTESKLAPETETNAGNTVWMDTRETSCLDEDAKKIDGQTGELESTTSALDGTVYIDSGEATAKAKAAIHFTPEKKIVVIHSEERI